MPRGTQGALLQELSARTEDGDLAALALLEAEPTAEVYLEHRIFNACTDESRIVSVDAVSARGGREQRFRAGMFIDTTGVALLGVLSGAQTLFGREARSSTTSPMPLMKPMTCIMGTPVFPHPHGGRTGVIPRGTWATEVSKTMQISAGS